ncbi:muscarinic acetylcholine receptor M2 [Chanos chanos]|uniref:Muscarinic acetylcholine receptor n=1 Tax=Chanos chanos TaxID=29144 RepID=A0A6J2URN0_CHACN|nr:muscarinic acetylcholine receptor M2-like [Chanos chanos]
MDSFNVTSTQSSAQGNDTSLTPESPFTAVEAVLTVVGLGFLSLITISGNVLVMVSIMVNRNLQTINNYFLFSLACADLIIGVFSMNLYTVYTVIGHWPLGPILCDLWLALDYVVSNASVMNLLIISFDRYFCVTRPLSYPINRSTKTAGMMIAAAWILSFVLWAPAILFWQFIEGKRTVSDKECKIQFFTNPAVTCGTAIAAFYLPVVTMTILYWQISKASRNRLLRRETHRLSGLCQEERDQACVAPEDQRVRRTSQRAEAMTQGQQSGLNSTTGEERHSDNDSTSASALASSSNKEEDMCSLRTNGDIKNTTHQSQGEARVRWPKLNSIVTVTQKGDIYKPCHSGQDAVRQSKRQQNRTSLVLSRRWNGSSSRERKVTRTIMAILLAFVITWTPYNVMVVINTFCSDCIPDGLWTMGYWLCYINSTVNPACYALCNRTFQNTLSHLLLCQYRKIRTAR